MDYTALTFSLARKLRILVAGFGISLAISWAYSLYLIVSSSFLYSDSFNIYYNFLLLPQIFITVALIFALSHVYYVLSASLVGASGTLERRSLLDRRSGTVYFHGLPFIVKCNDEISAGEEVEIARVHRSAFTLVLIAKS